MEIWQAIMLAGVGIIAGFLNVMAGGGSLLVLPILIFMDLDGPVANGTNRVAIVAQNVSAVGGFLKKGYSDLRTSLTLSLCAVPGAAVGAYLGTKISGELFNQILGVLMLVLLILMSRKPTEQPTVRPKRLVLGHVLMVGIGFYGGFIQAGVGFFLMAVLHRVLGFDLVRVNMHKVFIVGVYTLIALVIFAVKGQVIWMIGLTLAVGNAIGGWIGTHYTIKKGDHLIRYILNIVLVGMAITLLF